MRSTEVMKTKIASLSKQSTPLIPCPSFQQTKGVTLIEMLVVVALIGIGMMITISLYTSMSEAVAHEDGKNKINEVMTQEKIFFIQNRRYSLNFGDIGYENNQVLSDKEYYEIELGLCEGENIKQCVQVSAKPLTENTSDSTLTMNSRGEKTPAEYWD